MSYDPMEPYGPVIETTARVVSWNVWGRFGPWEDREPLLLGELRRLDPDIICLQEAWRTDDEDQAHRFGHELNYHHVIAGDSEFAGLRSGQAILSRWPIEIVEARSLATFDGGTGGGAVLARIDGPRGPIEAVSLILDWRLDHSHVRAAQLVEVLTMLDEHSARSGPLLMCGDFNTSHHSDELRAVVGLSPVHVPGMVFYDAVSMASDAPEAATWTTRNPYSRVGLYPERRFDHIFSHWPRLGGAGHPVDARVIGDEAQGDVWASDHFGVMADIRY